MSWRNLLFPPLWLVLCLTVVSGGLLCWVFIYGFEAAALEYGVYALSFYALILFCAACFTSLPPAYKKLKNRLYANKLSRRYLTDAAFKTHVGLYRSLAVNLLYALFNQVLAVVYHTHWFGIFALYYAILALLRFLLLRYIGRRNLGQNRVAELRRARLCGFVLLAVNLALSAAVLMMVCFNRGFDYPGVLIYVAALYTFYITISAIVELARYRRYNSPIIYLSSVIKFAAALVSMLNLETAMFSQFGADMSQEAQQIMLIATGAGIVLILVTASVYIIYKTSVEIRRSNINGHAE